MYELFAITNVLCNELKRPFVAVFADHEMGMALQELKLLLLSKSMDRISTADQHHTIVNALQSLLKVAEMRNKCCFFDDCAHPALALQNKFSLNISLENDRLLLQTGYGNQNIGSSHDLYGPSDGDTTDTDNSYATADEGYDVSNTRERCVRVT